MQKINQFISIESKLKNFKGEPNKTYRRSKKPKNNQIISVEAKLWAILKVNQIKHTENQKKNQKKDQTIVRVILIITIYE
jgi:hypothetical protein